MELNIVIKNIRFSALYKYVLLQENLFNHGIKIFVYCNNYKAFNANLINFINKYENHDVYGNYISQIQKYFHLKSFLDLGKIQNKNSHYLFSLDGGYSLTSVRDSILSVYQKERVILYKFRLCNDIACDFSGESFQETLLPSELYLNNSLFSKNYKNINYVRPIELIDHDNDYIDFHKQKFHVYEKYEIDEKKPIILFSFSIIPGDSILSYKECTERDILDKLFSDEGLHENFNILILFPHVRSYLSFLLKKKDISNKIKLIDPIDYSFFLRKNIISAMIGGISTTIIESLVNKIPVLNIIPNIYRGNSHSRLLNKRYNACIRVSDRFEGINTYLFEDWVSIIYKIIENDKQKKYNYKNKQRIWMTSNTLENYIIKKKFLPNTFNDSSSENSTQFFQI